MNLIRQKSFTIQEGGPKKKASFLRELGAKTALSSLIGLFPSTLIGATVGFRAGSDLNSAKEGLKWSALSFCSIEAFAALWGALDAVFTRAGYHRRNAEKVVDTNEFIDLVYKQSTRDDKDLDTENSATLHRYINENKDPKQFMINAAFAYGYCLILLNKPSSTVLEGFNEHLESMVQFNREADYAAQPSRDGFVVLVRAPRIEDVAHMFVDIISECHVPVNFISSKKLEQYKAKFEGQIR